MGTEAVFGARGFKARSGRTVKPQEDGSIRFGLGLGYLGRYEAMDAEEYFQAKRDAELGRWRSPVDPHLVMYVEPGDSVLVVDEQTGDHKAFTRAEAYEIEGLAYRRAARAYFEAHPEREPWEDAQPAEVWALTIEDRERGITPRESLYQLDGNGVWWRSNGTFLGRADWITAARRIWPEDAS